MPVGVKNRNKKSIMLNGNENKCLVYQGNNNNNNF